MVFWCHHTMRFNSSDISALKSKSESLGLVAWPAQEFPTSRYTHYRTFLDLRADFERYHFQQMVEPDSALYCNTYRLHHKLMLPWVMCAIDLNCISPLGSQSTACDLTRRPRFSYSGCHKYDTSIFNVILGGMFYFNSDYIPIQKIFTREFHIAQK